MKVYKERISFRGLLAGRLLALLLVCFTTLSVLEARLLEEAPSTDDATLIRGSQNHMAQVVIHNEQMQPVDRITDPLMTFTDPARANDRGTIWAFGTSGRPLAIMERYVTADRASWIQVASLTSTTLVRATLPVNQRWTPQSRQVKLKTLTDIQPPASQPGRRLLQMRQMSRRFTAHQFWDPDNSRFELRLMPSPLHRYEDPDGGIADGAIFAFCHGTNPEILLFLEAFRTKDAEAWRYAFASLGSAEMHVDLDDEEVWSLPRASQVVGSPLEPYWLTLTSVKD
ncbi:MAG: hypothetical protein R3C59_12460 [Planctomycetaceae bacterium]